MQLILLDLLILFHQFQDRITQLEGIRFYIGLNQLIIVDEQEQHHLELYREVIALILIQIVNDLIDYLFHFLLFLTCEYRLNGAALY